MNKAIMMRHILCIMLLAITWIDCLAQVKLVQSDDHKVNMATTNLNTRLSNNNARIDYLIITEDSLVDYFIPLRDWKRQKGIWTEIWPLSYFYLNFPWANTDLPFLIKTGIYYAHNYNQVKWVLLGADDDLIPSRDCCASVSTYTDNAIPCDLYYACLDNFSYNPISSFNWNANGNSLYGEVGDSIDLMPDVYISRMPVQNVTQISSIVEKTLLYEQKPHEMIKDTMLLVGVKYDTSYSSGSDSQLKSERMYNDSIAFTDSEWSGSRLCLYDTYTDFSGGSNYDVNALHLMEQIRHGYTYIHVASHGAYDRWSLENGSSLTTDDADTLTGAISPVIVTLACNTNAFDNNSQCLSESLIRNPNGGCVAFWGSSRYGWGASGTGIGVLDASFRYDCSFFKAIMCHKGNIAITFAEAITKAKSIYCTIQSHQRYRWLQFSLNAIGDPELPMYTCHPDSFTNVSVNYSGTDITVSTGGIDSCTIALTSDDSGESYFEVFEDASTAVFENVLCPFNLVITKRNYVPYRFHQPDVYIQDYTFQSDSAVNGRNIIVGRNVIQTAPNGDVIINTGNDVSFGIDGYSYIKGGFEVKNGVQFDIKQ